MGYLVRHQYESWKHRLRLPGQDNSGPLNKEWTAIVTCLAYMISTCISKKIPVVIVKPTQCWMQGKRNIYTHVGWLWRCKTDSQLSMCIHVDTVRVPLARIEEAVRSNLQCCILEHRLFLRARTVFCDVYDDDIYISSEMNIVRHLIEQGPTQV
jgi:hypothetical protein